MGAAAPGVWGFRRPAGIVIDQRRFRRYCRCCGKKKQGEITTTTPNNRGLNKCPPLRPQDLISLCVGMKGFCDDLV